MTEIPNWISFFEKNEILKKRHKMQIYPIEKSTDNNVFNKTRCQNHEQIKMDSIEMRRRDLYLDDILDRKKTLPRRSHNQIHHIYLNQDDYTTEEVLDICRFPSPIEYAKKSNLYINNLERRDSQRTSNSSLEYDSKQPRRDSIVICGLMLLGLFILGAMALVMFLMLEYNVSTEESTTSVSVNTTVTPGTTASSSAATTTAASAAATTTAAAATTTTTTATTTTTRRPRVNMSRQTPMYGATNASLTCTITDFTVWTLIIVVHNSEESNVVTPLVSLNANGTYDILKEEIRENIIVEVDVTPHIVTLTLGLKVINCSDQGGYTCTLITPDNMYIGKDLLEIVNAPTVPRLILPIEIIAYRTLSEPIACVGNVGYPEGMMYLQIKGRSSSQFTTLPANVTYDRKNCHVTAKAELIGFRPSPEFNGAVIKCIVENSRLLELNHEMSKSKVMTVISANICKVLINGMLRHPNTCRKYVRCRNAVPYVGLCPSKLCYNPRSGQCGETGLYIHTTTGLLNDGLTQITCRLLNLDNWNIISLKRHATSGSTKQDVVDVHRNGSVTWTDTYLMSRSLEEVFISAYETELTIWIFTLKCSDEGRYVCQASGQFNETYEDGAQLRVVSLPGTPTLKVSLLPQSDDDVHQHEISCTSDVGHPPGRLVLKMRRKNETYLKPVDFETFHESNTSCHAWQQGKYVFNGMLELNATRFVCEVESNSTQIAVAQRVELNRDNFILLKSLIPADSTHSCLSTPVREYIPHPEICNKFYLCDGGTSEVQHCPYRSLYSGGGQCTAEVSRSYCYGRLHQSLTAR